MKSSTLKENSYFFSIIYIQKRINNNISKAYKDVFINRNIILTNKSVICQTTATARVVLCTLDV